MELGRWGPLLGWALSVPSPLPQTWHTSLCQGSSGLKAWCFGHRGVSGIPLGSPDRGRALERSARSPPCTPQGGTGALVTLTLPPGTEPAQGPSWVSSWPYFRLSPLPAQLSVWALGVLSRLHLLPAPRRGPAWSPTPRLSPRLLVPPEESGPCLEGPSAWFSELRVDQSRDGRVKASVVPGRREKNPRGSSVAIPALRDRAALRQMDQGAEGV